MAIYSHRSRLFYISVVLLTLLISSRGYTTPPKWLTEACPACTTSNGDLSGIYILERGEDALMARSWLAANATKTIDVQYFIWSTDNIGILASEALLSAAERGVKVRVLVDDLLIDADDNTLLALATHPNASIKIYNPKHSVGTSITKRAWNVIAGFRSVNQRMHDKTAIFDGAAGITGGRNMADEYFDFNHHYNFRDRDVLLFGPVIKPMTKNFEEFWASELSIPVNTLLEKKLKKLPKKQIEQTRKQLHNYAIQETNFAPEVRQILNNLPTLFPQLSDDIIWSEAEFISDKPGKNDNRWSLSGGGESTDKLLNALTSAKRSVLIQSPYLVFPKESIELLKALIKRGVNIRISTNSLASTDNIMAFSGYYKQRQTLLDIGVEIFEFKPYAAIGQKLNRRTSNAIFAIHAKSMLIDDEKLYIGTFNLDPRSAHLNTEVGILVKNKTLARQLKQSIETDMLAENSWKISADNNPDDQVSLLKRVKVFSLSLLPIDPVL